MLRTARRSLARDRLSALSLTLSATAAILLLQLLQHTPGGAQLVERLGVVRASLPLWESLLRTPLSLFVPAPDLPVWGAALQVLLVFGIAELTVGRWATLFVAYAGTLAGTLYARHGVHVGARGADHLFALPWDDAFIRDTGPSAAVVALAVYVTWRYRAWLTGGITVAAMILEQALFPNLAGAEHLAAVLCALALAGGGELIARRLVRTADAWRPLLPPAGV
ncbi:hypothetical protein [Streptacidiphilus sp. PAMC 29251]